MEDSPSSRSLSRRQLVLSAMAVAVAAGLAFAGITDNKFWDDEANTAIFARNFLETGELSGWDGTNLIGYRDGAELDERLVNVFMPPLQYWLASAGIVLFGDHELGLRAPFVLAGLLCILALVVLARGLLGVRFPWALPAWVVALAPAFILYIRNCRYYSPGAALAVGVLAASVGEIPSRRAVIVRASLAAASAVLLMETNYFYAAGVLASLPLLLILERNRTRRHIVVMGTAIVAAGVVGAHILATKNPFDAPVPRPDEMEGIERFATLLWWHLRDMGTFEFFPVLLLPVLALPFLFKRLSERREDSKAGIAVVAMMIVSIIVTAVFTPQSASKSSIADMRYLVPLIPMGAVVTAVALRILWSLGRPLAAVVFAVLVFSNILHLGFMGTYNAYLPTRGVECTLCQYLGEVTSDRTTNTEALIEYIEKLPEDDVLLVVPPFMGYSPMYYMPERRFCCQLKEDHPLTDEMASQLPDYVFWERAHEDLDTALISAMPPSTREGPMSIRDVYMGYYHYKDVLDIPARDCSKPEIPWHSFDGKEVKTEKHHRFFVVTMERR